MQFLALSLSLSSLCVLTPVAPRTPIRASVARSHGVVCQEQVTVKAELDDEKTRRLFAWLACAFCGDARYNNLMLAFASIFAEHPKCVSWRRSHRLPSHGSVPLSARCIALANTDASSGCHLPASTEIRNMPSS